MENTNASFYCPITGDLMIDPVVDSEGNTYERIAIESWIDGHKTSPITRNVITLEDLRPNRSLKNAIEETIASGNQIKKRLDDHIGFKDNTKMSAPQLSLTVTTEKLRTEWSTSCPADCENFVTLISAYAPPLPDLPDRMPSDIVLVVDVSGSMGTDASAQGVEDCGLSLLDIVKHAVKTVISTLNENDRLSIVSYSNNATMLFDLMPMNNVGKENAISLLSRLIPGGMTNLWDGLYTGLEILKNRSVSNGGGSSVGNNAALLLLTDGEPNIEPPRGHLPTLKRYKEACNGRFPGVISTFGFGYSLNSQLLRKIALDGGGMYAFIPDSGFVGTAFVNSLANILSTITCDAQLSISVDPLSRASISVLGDVPHITLKGAASGGILATLGCVQTGQSIDTVVCISIPKGEVKGIINGTTTFPLLRATMNYTVNAHHMYTHVWDTVSTDADTSTGTSTGTGSGVSVAGGGAGQSTSPSAPSTSTGAGGGGSGKGFLTLDSPGKGSGSSPGAFKSPVSPGKDDRRQTLNVTAVGPFLQRDNCTISIVEEKSTEDELRDHQMITSHYLRASAVTCLLSLEVADQSEALSAVKIFIEKIKSWLATNNEIPYTPNERGETPELENEQCTSHQRICSLLLDFEGQVTEATSRSDWLMRWGRHYIPSLQRSHALQQCNNFKDPGIQCYGGKLFRSIRDFADDKFCQLPAPVPIPEVAYRPTSSRYLTGGGPRSSSPATPTPAINMSAFNSRDHPCFHGSCTVLLSNKKCELLRNLKRGDILINGDVIQCVVRSDCLHGKAKLVKIIDKNYINAEKTENSAKIEGFRDLYITQWHPIKSINGVWAFPNDICPAEEMICDAVYSFLVLKSHAGTSNSDVMKSGSHGINGDMIIVRDILKNEKEESIYSSTIRINGIECAALAHGIPGQKVISHPFYGTLKVEKELRKCRGWNVGLVHFRTDPSPSPFLIEIGNSAVQLESTCSINNQFDFDGDMLQLSNDRTSDAPYVLDHQYGTECSGCVLKDARTGLANGFLLTLEV